MQLNPSQRLAVETIEGPVLVFAGAGSGKTRVITHRIFHMLQIGIPASQIVALSFTNKSAGEMRERLKKMMPKEKLRGLELSTFHALGLKILRSHITKLGYGEKFVLLNAQDQEALVLDLCKIKKIDPKAFPPKEILRSISFRKNTQSQTNVTSEQENLFEDYQKELRQRNSIDFDDLILLPKRILVEHPEIASDYHYRHRYFMVDEFQDTNRLQYEFLKVFRGPSKNLCVVGDDDQSIYAFRGSEIDLILGFEKEFPETKVVRLLENYRSTSLIIQAANSLIQNNKTRRPKELYSSIPSQEKVEYFELSDEKEEASFAISQIQSLLIKNEVKGNEIALLFRTNFQTRPFEEELRTRNIPYKVVGGYQFFDRKEVRDCIAYLRFIANPKDDLALLRILNYPKRGIGSTSIQTMLKFARENSLHLYDVLLRLAESVDFLKEIKPKLRGEINSLLDFHSDFQKRFFHGKMTLAFREMIQVLQMEKAISEEESEEKTIKARMYNIGELANMMNYFEEDLEMEVRPDLFGFLGRLSLLMEDDPREEEGKEDRRVQLLTIHQSKGLEYDIVWVHGLEEGILPNGRVMEGDGTVDEERRLLYVAMTRSRRKLYLTSARTRRRFGVSSEVEPSRFLSELDRSVVDFSLWGKPAKEEAALAFLADLEKWKLCF